MRNFWRTAGLVVLMLPGCGDDPVAPASDMTAAHSDMSSGCPAAWLAPPTVDPSIAVPSDGGSVLLHAAAVGTQDYVCSAGNVDGGGGGAPFAWTLVAPAARLDDCAAVTVGSHSAPAGAASPQWTNLDGSVIVGHRVAAFPVGGDAIPWLLLGATSHSGTGIMTRVLYVQRVNTVGGVASGPCDAAHDGATTSVPYTADYYFFGN